MNHLAPYEPAARIFCTKTSTDPDEPIAVPHPLGIAVPHEVPRWQLVADELIHLSLMLSAMREAAVAQRETVQ